MIFTEIERNLARDLFALVARETADPAGGVARASYGEGETRALRIVAENAHVLGLETATDPCANLVMSTQKGPHGPGAILIGSHLDAVPNGGNYDGLAGVVAALLLLKKAKDRGSKHPLVGMGFRGEESAWFGIPHVGAKAATGRITNDDLNRFRRDGQRLGSYMQSLGADVPAIAGGEKFLDSTAIREYWELHIEQGPLLDATKVPVAAVTGIRGHARTSSARIVGQAGHSGTTPHGMRKDAVMRFADFMHAMDDKRDSIERAGGDVVFTVGIAGTNPTRHAVTVIADEVNFSLDVRSLSLDVIEDFMLHARAWGKDMLALQDLKITVPCQLDRSLVGRTMRAAKDLGITCVELPSGAGHDASVLVVEGIPSGMVFVRNKNGSHNPHEAMDVDDFMLGVETMWVAING